MLPGVTIGSDVIVGAGSVVTRNVPGRTVVLGSPGRVLMSLDDWLARRDLDTPVITTASVSSQFYGEAMLPELRAAASRRSFLNALRKHPQDCNLNRMTVDTSTRSTVVAKK